MTNVYVKTFDVPQEYLNDEWLLRYSQLRIKFPELVEVYEVTQNKIVMEKINGDILESIRNTILPEQAYDICSELYRHISLQLKTDHENITFHSDMNLNNIIIQNGNIRIIDPDSVITIPLYEMSMEYFQVVFFQTSSLLAESTRKTRNEIREAQNNELIQNRLNHMIKKSTVKQILGDNLYKEYFNEG